MNFLFSRLAAAFLAAILVAQPASAQLLLTGVGRWSAAAAFAQNAVTFDNYATLAVQGAAPTGLSNSSVGTISFWYRCNPGQQTPSFNQPNTCNIMPILGNFTASAQNSEQVSGVNVVLDNQANFYGTMRLNLNDATGGGVAAHACLTMIASGQPYATWTHWLMTWDMTSANHVAIYKNGVLAASDCNATNYTGAFPLTVPVASTAGFGVLNGNWTGTGNLNSGAPGQGQIADLLIDFTTSVLTGGTSTIPAGTIAKFIAAGKPVDLGASCATPLGAQPQFCFRGPKASFFTNLGSLGAAGMTNGQAPTALNVVYDAPQSASAPAPAHTVVPNWAASNLAADCTTTSCLVRTGGNTIVAGDLLIFAENIRDTAKATGDHSPTCPPASGDATTWTLQYVNWDNGGSNSGFPVDLLVCTKLATASDAGAATTFTGTWTTAATSGQKAELLDFQGVDQTTPVEAVAGLPASGSGVASAGTNFTASVSVVVPSISPTSSNDMLVAIFGPISASAVNTTTLPSTLDEFIRLQVAPQILVSTKQLNASGATGTFTATHSSAAGSNAVALAIKPS